MTPESQNIGVGARRPLSANGWANLFPSTTRIGVHCYATFLVLRFTACSVTLTAESQYRRKRIVQSSATEGRNKINYWERCHTFGSPETKKGVAGGDEKESLESETVNFNHAYNFLCRGKKR
jgi:hypothetical protein